MNDSSRARCALIGLAVGDALGVTLEFRQPGTFEPIDDMIGGVPFGLPPGLRQRATPRDPVGLQLPCHTPSPYSRHS